ncbi:MAG: proton-conducting transporter membrane subunit [Methanoregula sp.]|jgi:formate hydrogenlyase subunit 3/multisubunit Na+/H+ antiporter MnhD subunit
MIGLLLFGALTLLVAGTVIPLVGLARDTRPLRTLSLAALAAASVLLTVPALLIMISGTPYSWDAWAPFPGFVVSFVIDRLAAFFLAIIGTVTFCVAVYSSGYIEHMDGGSRRNLLCGCMNLFVLAMVLVVASATTVSFLLFWELMAASSFFLVMYEYTAPDTQKAGIFYFVMTHLSTLFVMLGIIMLFIATGSFAIAPVHETPESAPLVTASFIALLVGFSIKAGIIPFHKWLPYAHPASPSPVSALMSAVMLKVAIYGLIRFVLDVYTPDLTWGVLILAMGTASAVLGVIYAYKEHDIKGMLAYSSIENIGIIFVGIGLYVIFAASGLGILAEISLIAALFHSLNHALFKSLLFLSAGSVVNATHTRDIEKMGGLAGRMPYTSALFFVGALAISALPPLNGFASELLIYIAYFQSVAVTDPLVKIVLVICLALFALTSALSAACFVKAYGSVFLAKPRSEQSAAAHEADLPMIVGPAILAALCVILGVFSFQILAFFGLAFPFPDMLLVSLLLLGMTAFVYIVLYFTASHEVRVTETWGCGVRSQPATTEYTGHGFSEPAVTIFSSIYRTKKVRALTYYDKHNCIMKDGTGEIRLVRFFEEYLYLPIARTALAVAAQVSRLENGCLDTYLLYVFIAIVAVIVFVGVSL